MQKVSIAYDTLMSRNNATCQYQIEIISNTILVVIWSGSDTITRKKEKRVTGKHEGLYLYYHGYCVDGDTWSANFGVWTKGC